MQPSMKIQSIVATETHVPTRKGYVDSAIHGDGAWKHLPKWILEIQFDNGIVGLGESPRGVTWPEVKQFGEFLVGKRFNEIQLQRIFLPLEASNDLVAVKGSQVPIRRWEYDYPRPFPYFGFECALFDAWGKVSGLPV